jgi:hypothetical protein
MAQNKQQTFGPVALTTTLTTNVIAPAAAGAGAVGYTATATYILIKMIWIANKTGVAATWTLYLGATGANAAGTEIGVAVSIPANSVQPYYFANGLRLEGTNGFLVGGSGTATALTLTAVGEVGLV